MYEVSMSVKHFFSKSASSDFQVEKTQHPNVGYGLNLTSNGQRSMLEGTFDAAGATARKTGQQSVACTAVNRSTKASSLLQYFQCRK